MDSRSTEPGELFFALVAGRNGHDFVPHAANKGAGGAMISQKIVPPGKDFGIIQVKDTLLSLQELAKNVLKEQRIKIVGITGSAGKTSTKEFTFALLKTKFNPLKSEGNFNNQIGLPLSILKLNKEQNIALLEMGMSKPGEITELTRIAPPDIAVLTNIHPVHLEFFDSTYHIALAKKEILHGIKKNGTAVLNGDDPLVQKIGKEWIGKKLFFGLSEKNDVSARNLIRSGNNTMAFDLYYGTKKERITLPFVFKSYLYNFLAAATVAYALDVSLEEILPLTKSLKPFPMRGTIHHLKNNLTLIDDTYNSNPAALETVLNDLSHFQGKRKIAVLGDMLELGDKEIEYHIQAGKQVRHYGLDLLITVGPLSKYIAEGAFETGMSKAQIHSFKNSDETAERICSLLKAGDTVLVKGSRGIKMDKIVKTLWEKG